MKILFLLGVEVSFGWVVLLREAKCVRKTKSTLKTSKPGQVLYLYIVYTLINASEFKKSFTCTFSNVVLRCSLWSGCTGRSMTHSALSSQD